MNTAKKYIRLPSKNRDGSVVETTDKNLILIQSNLNNIKHASDNLSLAIDKISDYLNNNISLPQIEKHLDDISTQTNTLIDDYNAHFVSPSVIGNFVNFSDASGSQSDSGWSYQDFALFDHKHTVLVKPQTDTEILYINTFGKTTILSGLDVSGGQTISGDITVSGNLLNVNAVSFNLNPSVPLNSDGLLRWNPTDGTLDLGMASGDITQQIGQELFVKVRNVSSGTISNGTPVYVSGRTGNRPNIYPAISSGHNTSCILGVTTQDITSPSDGYVTTFGYVRNIKTNYSGSGAWGTTWTAGDTLYVSKTSAGQLTNIEPTIPHHSDIVGFVEIVHSNLGSILVNIKHHETLEGLSNVNGTPLATTGQFPVWNQASGYFDFDRNTNEFSLSGHTHHLSGTFGSGSNLTTFDSTGYQSMSGSAKPWRDQLTDSLNLQQNGTGISINKSESTVEFTYNSTYNATFTLADSVFTNIQLNHDKELSGNIHPHIHWIQEKNYIPNFLLEYRWQINGGTKVTGWTKLKCNTNAFNYVSGSIHQISYSSGITPPSGSNLSDIVQFRIYRDTTNASTEFSGVCPYNTGGNASVGILAFDVHFQINSLGSTDELSK